MQVCQALEVSSGCVPLLGTSELQLTTNSYLRHALLRLRHTAAAGRPVLVRFLSLTATVVADSLTGFTHLHLLMLTPQALPPAINW